MIWHVLDVRAIWVKEFASALAAQVPTLGWHPRITNYGMFRKAEAEITLDDPLLQIRYFPLQRGFAKFPMNLIAREDKRLAQRLSQQSTAPDGAALVCCSPHYAAVAERWPGPVIYYATDLFVDWGDDPKRIESFERRLCKVGNLVCPDSQRIADHLIANCGCERDKIHLSPMATRGANILRQPPGTRLDPPADISDLARPLAGVIGNLAANMDWELLQESIKRLPWLSWVFVGPTDMPIKDPVHSSARAQVMREGGRVRFVGSKPYGQLRDYARAFDVAVLPYRKVEPTYSGSSTRFYEHLAACKPIIATPGTEELLHKTPLLRIVQGADELVPALDELRQTDFHDGQEERRWKASQGETWEQRAASMIGALTEKIADDRTAAQSQ